MVEYFQDLRLFLHRGRLGHGGRGRHRRGVTRREQATAPRGTRSLDATVEAQAAARSLRRPGPPCCRAAAEPRPGSRCTGRRRTGGYGRSRSLPRRHFAFIFLFTIENIRYIAHRRINLTFNFKKPARLSVCSAGLMNRIITQQEPSERSARDQVH